MFKASGEVGSYQYPFFTATASEAGVLSVTGDGCSVADQAGGTHGSVKVVFSLPNGAYACSLSLRDGAGKCFNTAQYPVIYHQYTGRRHPSKPNRHCFSEYRRKTRVTFSLEVDHWFSQDATESIATITIGGGGTCDHFNDRLAQ